MGPDWAGDGDAALAAPNDEVRLTLAKALESEAKVVPVLADGAGVPPENDLPADLAPLAGLIAVDLTHGWQAGVDAVARALTDQPRKRRGWRDLSRRVKISVVASVVGIVGTVSIVTQLLPGPGPAVDPTVTVEARPMQFNITHRDYIATHANDPGVEVSVAPADAVGDEYKVSAHTGKGSWLIKWTTVEALSGEPVPALTSRPAWAFRGPIDRDFSVWAGPCDAERARDFRVVFELWKQDGAEALKTSSADALSCRPDE